MEYLFEVSRERALLLEARAEQAGRMKPHRIKTRKQVHGRGQPVAARGIGQRTGRGGHGAALRRTLGQIRCRQCAAPALRQRLNDGAGHPAL